MFSQIWYMIINCWTSCEKTVEVHFYSTKYTKLGRPLISISKRQKLVSGFKLIYFQESFTLTRFSQFAGMTIYNYNHGYSKLPEISRSNFIQTVHEFLNEAGINRIMKIIRLIPQNVSKYLEIKKNLSVMCDIVIKYSPISCITHCLEYK